MLGGVGTVTKVKIAVVYVYPALDARRYQGLARRFVDSYTKFPPGATNHTVHVIVNAGDPGRIKIYERIFRPLSCQFTMHSNIGKDIGAFQLAAESLKDFDLMICLGAPVHCRVAGWLDYLVRIYESNGPGLYGAWGFHQPRPHIRTTAFWLPPALLSSYPHRVTNELRYEFEHGTGSIRAHAASFGLDSFMVTLKGCFTIADWHHVANEDCLFLDQHTQRIGYK
jgi:hypothetical protein